MSKEKAMSSRLLTMKFMQRAAASSAPSTPEGPPSKRARLSYGSNASPSTPSSDLRAVQAAMAEEELKRNIAVERQAAEAGETRWMLSVREPERTVPAFRVVQASFADIDSTSPPEDLEDGEYDDESHTEKKVAGRMSFGKISKKDESDNSNDSESESSEDDDDDPVKAMVKQARKEAAQKLRAERKVKKQADLAHLARFASDRRQKEVNLNKLKGLSSTNSGSNFGTKRNEKRRKRK